MSGGEYLRESTDIDGNVIYTLSPSMVACYECAGKLMLDALQSGHVIDDSGELALHLHGAYHEFIVDHALRNY